MNYTLTINTRYEKIKGKYQTYQVIVDNEQQANDHALQILKNGYKRQRTTNSFEWISPYSILSITISSNVPITSGYNDLDITA